MTRKRKPVDEECLEAIEQAFQDLAREGRIVDSAAGRGTS
jgi:hypothetical protein